jgi:transcriptional regulator with XRE-family HTH domain
MDAGHAPDPLVELGARLDRLRRQQGLTVAALAERTGLGRTEVDAVLQGKANAGISILLRLAAALEVEAGELLAGMSWEPRGGGGAFQLDDSSPG